MVDDEPVKVPGELDMVGLFAAEALSLAEAVARGGLLHRTKNIRDSGALLERRLREIIGSRLPPQFQLQHGYGYDIESRCTPQIDGMLVSTFDNHAMAGAEGGAVYAPFTSIRAILEIKSSVRNVANQLSQTQEIVTRIQKMQNELSQRKPGQFTFPELISVLFFATSDGSKLAEFQAWHRKNPSAGPTLTVFLDRGRILTGRHLIHDFLLYDTPQPISFDDHKNAGDWYLCAPEQDDQFRSGRVLLWLYFFLLNHALAYTKPAGDSSDRHLPTAFAFTDDAVSRFGLSALGKLNDLSDWDKT